MLYIVLCDWVAQQVTAAYKMYCEGQVQGNACNKEEAIQGQGDEVGEEESDMGKHGESIVD